MEKTGKGEADMVPHFLAKSDANGAAFHFE